MNQTSKCKENKISAYLKSEKFKPSKLSKYFWALSATIFLVGFIMLCTLGFNLGLDFTGGNIMEIKAGAQIENAETKANTERAIQQVLNEVAQEYGGVLTLQRAQIVNSGADASLSFQYQNIAGKSTEEMAEINTKITEALKVKLASVLAGDVASMVQASESKSASASGELLTNSFLALGIAIIAILIYVAIRFDLIGGLSAVITLFHDVILMCALVVIFRIEIDAAFITDIITILGYSVNNTIVVFDRLRENTKKDIYAGKSNKEIADISVRQTLTRTFNTSFTTLLAVILLAIIGVSAIREFIIPIIFGLIVGTYAAIFISAPLWATIITNSRFDKRKIKQKQNKIEKSRVIEAEAQAIK